MIAVFASMLRSRRASSAVIPPPPADTSRNAAKKSVPTATFGSATCTNSGNCTVTGAANGVNGRDAAAFDAVVAWMEKFYPELQASNVRIIYQNVGLGYSGDPTGPDVAPLTTVELTGLSFRALVLFGGNIGLPDINASLTLEDGECSSTGDCGSSN